MTAETLRQPPNASWVRFGAIETDRFGPAEHCARLLLTSDNPDTVASGERQLEAVASCRARRAGEVQGSLI